MTQAPTSTQAPRKATDADINAIVELVNSTYRPADGSASWTNETSFMSGDRTDVNQVQAMLLNPNAVILLRFDGDKLVACVQVEKIEEAAKIGLLTVRIENQQQGLGHDLLAAAENYALIDFCVQEIRMHVLMMRAELIDFYIRRGYKKTGIIRPYPANAGFGIPLKANLQFEVLTKTMGT